VETARSGRRSRLRETGDPIVRRVAAMNQIEPMLQAFRDGEAMNVR